MFLTAATAFLVVVTQLLIIYMQRRSNKNQEANNTQLLKYTHEVNSKLDEFIKLVGEDGFRRGEKAAEDAAKKKTDL